MKKRTVAIITCILYLTAIITSPGTLTAYAHTVDETNNAHYQEAIHWNP